MAVSYAPGLRYDASSLVPDVGQDLGKIIGGVMGAVKERRTDAELEKLEDGLVDGVSGEGAPVLGDGSGEVQLLGKDGAPAKRPPTGMDFLMQPENVKILRRMEKLRPGSSKFAMQLAQTSDQRTLEKVKEESVQSSRFFQAFLDTKDPKERARFLAGKIRELEEAGEDASKLREMIGLTNDQQTLHARRQMILAGDAELLATNGLKNMTDVLNFQSAQLDLLQKQRDFAQGKYGDVSAMRDDFTKQSKSFLDVRDAYGRIQASAGDNTASGDMALIFSYMKLLDPGSGVKEGEYANASNAAGIPERIRNMYNKAKDGQILDGNQRAQFRNTANNLFSKAEASHGKLRSEFTRLADLRGFNPAEVIVDFSAPSPAQPGGGPAAPAGAAPREGQTAKNPKTGQRIVFRGGQWAPLEGDGGASGRY